MIKAQEKGKHYGHLDTRRSYMSDMAAMTSLNLYYSLKADPYYSKQINRILKLDECDIEPDFLGFVEAYYYLSKLVPKDRTIYDLGEFQECFIERDNLTPIMRALCVASNDINNTMVKQAERLSTCNIVKKSLVVAQRIEPF
jgi:hypothetical protein